MSVTIEQAARGNGLPQARLTDRAVRAIRRNVSGWTLKQTALIYGVHWRTIDKIRSDCSWTHPEAYPEFTDGYKRLHKTS